MTTLDLGFDVGAVRNPGGEPPWFPYQVPVDLTHDRLRSMAAAELLVAYHDSTIVAARAAAQDGWLDVDEATYEALVDVRDRLEREIHRRLLGGQPATTRRPRLGEGGLEALGGNQP